MPRKIRCSFSASRRRLQAGRGFPLVAALALAGLATVPVRAASQAGWKWLGGPETANAAALAVDPANPRVVYAGTGTSGMYKTVNGGGAWLPINRGLPDPAVRAVAVNPHDPKEVFLQAPNNTGGVYLSSDGGSNWVAQPQGHLPALFDARDDTMFAWNGAAIFWSIDRGFTWMFRGGVPDSPISALARDTVDPNVFFASTYGGLFKSTNGGSTFTRQSTPIVFAQGGGTTTVVTDPAAPGAVYVSTFAGIWKSADSGASWRLATRGLRGLRDHRRLVETFLAVPTSPVTLYAVVSDSLSRSELYRSTDAAATWVDQGFFGAGALTFSVLAAAPSDPDILYAGHPFEVPGVFTSTDGGRSWSFAGSGLASPFQGVTFQPGSLGGLYALGATAWKSIDGGATWRDLKIHLDTLQLEPLHPDTLAAIHYGAFTSSADGGQSWSQPQFPPACLALTEIVLAPSPRPSLYALTTITQNDCLSSPGLRSTDGGRTWHEIPELGNAVGLVLDPADLTTLYAARFTETDIVKSSDGGKTWTVVSPSPAPATGGRPVGLAISPLSGELYLTITGGAVFTSPDRGQSWQASTLPLPPLTQPTLVADPYVASRVYAVGSKSLLRSDDGGRSWLSPARGLTRSVLLQGVTAAPDGALFVATNNGIFSLAPGPP
jgi:photosystem II stability/assembly factor-like uncharacterized protein